MTKLWGGRFSGEPAPELLAFTESLSFDHRLVADDAAVLLAHARALARAGFLADAAVDAAARALESVVAAIAAGDIAITPSDEDVHTLVERALLERIPDVAPRLRAGLSRNDRVAAALRRWLLREGAAIVAGLTDLIETLAARARSEPDAIMPGYTHLQRAQPVRLAHHLLAHAFALTRDAARLCDALARTDESPLGAGALAGSTLGLTHDPADAGFSRAMPNSLDAVAARDFVAEFLAASAILGVHISRLGEEIVLWTTEEFAFAELSDAHATGSSLMPQKKNPDIFELARGRSGRLIGNLTATLAMLKGLPLAYNRDLQEDKEALFDSVDALRTMLAAITPAIAAIAFRTERMASAAGAGTLLATDLAEYLVGKGVAFRDAHEIVGRLVRLALESGRALPQLTFDELRAASAAIEADVAAVLDARSSVDRRPSPGPSASSVERQLADIERALSDVRARAAR